MKRMSLLSLKFLFVAMIFMVIVGQCEARALKPDFEVSGLKYVYGAWVCGGICGTDFIVPVTVTDPTSGCVYDVQGVYNEAFTSCENLKSLTITHSIEIGEGAFCGCSSLERITGLERCSAVGATAFVATGFKELFLPPGNYGNFCFQGCEKLTNVVVALGVKVIPKYMFSSCGSLSKVVLTNDVVAIDDFAFSGCGFAIITNLPPSLQTIGAESFSHNKKMTQIVVPESVKTIGRCAFGYSGLKSIDLSKTGIRRLGTEMFSGCGSLGEVKLPVGLTEIGDSAFCQSAITNCDLSHTQIEVIEDNAFGGCTNLEGMIVLPETLRQVGALAFATARKPLNVMFLGPPPEAEGAAFSAMEELTTMFPNLCKGYNGYYTNKYASAWQAAIAEWDAAHGTTNEWHGLKFTENISIEVEPTAWEMDK